MEPVEVCRNRIQRAGNSKKIKKTRVYGSILDGDIPKEILMFRVQSQEERRIQYFVTWRQKEDGTCPLNSTVWNYEFKDSYPKFLISFYEDLIISSSN